MSFIFMVPGLPVIYQGDEFGMPGANDPDNRRPMRFAGERLPNERWLASQVGKLGRLRRCHRGLRAGALRPIFVSQERLALARGAGEELALLLIERATEEGPTQLPLPTDAQEIESWLDIFSGETYEGGKEALSWATPSPFTARLLVSEGHRCARASQRSREQ